MADVMTREQRSRCMSRIRGRDTSPELQLRRALWALGLRYKVNAGLPGKPDIVFCRQRVAIFVDGCFWHGCTEHGVRPKTNKQFWQRKIEGNITRDKRINNLLSRQGWKVVRVWEHEIGEDLEGAVDRISAMVCD